MMFSDDKEFAARLKAFLSLEDGVYRRSGRTTLLARIFVEIALETGREINVFDHYIAFGNEQRKVHEMLRACERYWMELKEHTPYMKLMVDPKRGTIKFVQLQPHPIPPYYMKNRIDPREFPMEMFLKTGFVPFDETASMFPIKELKEQLKKLESNNKKLLLICC